MINIHFTNNDRKFPDFIDVLNASIDPYIFISVDVQRYRTINEDVLALITSQVNKPFPRPTKTYIGSIFDHKNQVAWPIWGIESSGKRKKDVSILS